MASLFQIGELKWVVENLNCPKGSFLISSSKAPLLENIEFLLALYEETKE